MIAEVVHQANETDTSESNATKRRFTIEEYGRLVETGILNAGERVELVEGEIFVMGAINVAHAATVRRLIQLLLPTLSPGIVLDAQNPIRLPGESLLQPDVVLLQPRPDLYADDHPGVESLLLVIEVSDTTLRYDRSTKGVLYAAAGIREYWIVNLSGRQLEVYREPSPYGYRNVKILSAEDAVAMLALPDFTLSVAAILGTEPWAGNVAEAEER